MVTFNQKKIHGGPPQFSPYHPVIPKLYTPGWMLDMTNRDRIVANCKLAGVINHPTEASMYWEKRQRLNTNEPCINVAVEKEKDSEVPREQLLRPPIYSHLSKYQSSLMSRYC